MGVKPPHGLTPDGHLRGLPQSFTRSQKERPLSESIVIPTVRALVAIILHHDDEFATPVFSHSSANFRRKASASNAELQLFNMGAPDFSSLTLTNVKTQSSGCDMKTEAGRRLFVPGSRRRRLSTKSKSSGLKP